MTQSIENAPHKTHDISGVPRTNPSYGRDGTNEAVHKDHTGLPDEPLNGDRVVGVTPDGAPVSQNERIAAARLRVTLDRQRGRETEEWIVKLSQETPVHSPQPRNVQIAAARARVSADKRRNIETPQWIIELSQEEPVHTTEREKILHQLGKKMQEIGF